MNGGWLVARRVNTAVRSGAVNKRSRVAEMLDSCKECFIKSRGFPLKKSLALNRLKRVDISSVAS